MGDDGLKLYVELFNRGEYFDAHEELEQLWMETNDSIREYYQGLIQLAVAMTHFEDGNASGARSLLRTGREKVLKFDGDKMVVDGEGLANDMEAYFQGESGALPTVRYTQSMD